MSQPVLFDSSRESTPSSVIDDLLTKISDDIDISDDLRTKRILERVISERVDPIATITNPLQF
jgi:hypothetical protein